MKNLKTHANMREKIIGAAQELFARYSYKKTTMDEIAKAADKAKSSIYYYFGSKEDIFQAVGETEIQKWQAELIKTVSRETTARGKLTAYIKARMSAIQSLSAFYSFLAEEYFEHYSMVEKLRVELDREELIILGNILKEGVEQKVFAIDNPDTTASAILNILKGLEHIWLREKDTGKLQKDITTLLNILLLGLLKRKP